MKALPRLTETQVKAIARLWDSITAVGTDIPLIVEASVAMGWAFPEGHPVYDVESRYPKLADDKLIRRF